jgi:hypothetical protein
MPRKGMPGDLQSVASSEDSDDDDDDDDDDDRSTSSFEDDGEDHSEKSETEAESDRDETEEINKLIRKESKDVLMWREIVTGMLVITAALVTITTYVLLSREEVDDFTHSVSNRQAMFCLSLEKSSNHLTFLFSLEKSRRPSYRIRSSSSVPCTAQCRPWPMS